jgi:hypothetical protein
MSAVALLQELSALGFSLTDESGGIAVSPASQLSPDQRQAIRDHKAELLQLLTANRPQKCPRCHGPLTKRRACWKCCERLCHCGRPTGSAFIELCRPCEVAWLREQGVYF